MRKHRRNPLTESCFIPQKDSKKGVRVTRQRYENYSHDLAYCAILDCFKSKWRRNDILTFIEEWTGISRLEIWQGELEGSPKIKYEVADQLAYVMDDVMEGIMRGENPDLDAVKIRTVPDGMTGKIRNIAYLCIMHQLLGHIVKLGLEPFFRARILPTQHASLPKHGQTQLALQVRRYLRKGKLKIKCFQKTDCTGAYASLQYAVLTDLFRREIPSATWIIKTMEFLATCAPGGHLIIGGYLDAWLFNLAMSYGIRAVYTQGRTRRGKFHRYVERIETFMDDFALLAQTATGIKRAVAYLTVWMKENLKMQVRTTTDIIYWLSPGEENAHRTRDRPAQRGCPGLDMGGYRIYRTHMTMRRRVAKRVIRTFLRAWREYERTGTLPRQRARSLISRNGPVKFTYSRGFRKKYHVDELFKVAKRITAYWGRVRTRKRKEHLIYVLQKCSVWREAVQGAAGAFA